MTPVEGPRTQLPQSAVVQPQPGREGEEREGGVNSMQKGREGGRGEQYAKRERGREGCAVDWEGGRERGWGVQ